MRRILILLAVLSTTLSAMQLPALAEREVAQALVQAQNEIPEWRYEECRYSSLQEAVWSVHEIRLTMQCAIEKWSVPGGFDKALSVARCESGADLRDPGGDGYIGTFQQAERYWPGRQDGFNPQTWERDLSENGNNPRANVVVSIRMVHADNGWDHWEMGKCA